MVRRGSSVSNDAQDFDLAMTLRTLRGNFGLSRLFLFFFFYEKEKGGKNFRKQKQKTKKTKKQNKFRCKVKREERSLHKLKNSVW